MIHRSHSALTPSPSWCSSAGGHFRAEGGERPCGSGGGSSTVGAGRQRCKRAARIQLRRGAAAPISADRARPLRPAAPAQHHSAAKPITAAGSGQPRPCRNPITTATTSSSVSGISWAWSAPGRGPSTSSYGEPRRRAGARRPERLISLRIVARTDADGWLCVFF
eukprot:SAG31_NODE_382_length_16456_cov_5.532983_1_plen_165_part_00